MTPALRLGAPSPEPLRGRPQELAVPGEPGGASPRPKEPARVPGLLATFTNCRPADWGDACVTWAKAGNRAEGGRCVKPRDECGTVTRVRAKPIA